jgi:hypothetical protein
MESTILARQPACPNLAARLKGRGEAPLLLIYAQVEVVSTENCGPY